MRLFYSPQYVLAGHAFDTTRKSMWVADSLSASPIAGIELIAPAPLDAEHILQVHDPSYVRSIQTGEPRSLAESQGFGWDEGMWPMVLASNGGAAAAAVAALTDGVAGSLSSGLHHARYGSGVGFCTFNGLVIAARTALGAGARSVLVLDLDAHCGGGTASLIEREDRIHQADVSVNTFDSYRNADRVHLDLVFSGPDYLPTIRQALADLDGQSFDLCLYNAGMDPCEECATGGMSGITREVLAERERLVFEWCRARAMPVAFVVAGGYVGPRLDRQGLVALHRLTLEAASSP